MTVGHYIVADNDCRVHTTAFFDGENWWLPGSELAFEPDDFGSEGRFTIQAPIVMPVATYGHYDVEMARAK